MYRCHDQRSDGDNRRINEHNRTRRSASSRNPMLRERSEFVFENFAVPFHRGAGSEEMEGVLGSENNISLGSGEDELNEIDLDSLDGNHSDTGHEAGRQNIGDISTEHLRGNFGTDVDDHGIEFRSLGRSADNSILTDPNITPLKSASDPIDLISF